ncbi:SGNH/GDSL hydrolase family protein [Microvirga massiliensis]|uniref:SGNH/GDSL hydrolase family protein n=1 Tax=Microvirga massiliensis TaxID=1033741 RepID=UPI00062B5AC8|nr:SGNH family hydrolase [Microvirga massiliensis]
MRWRLILACITIGVASLTATRSSAQPGDPRYYYDGRNAYPRQAPPPGYGRPPPGYYPGMLIQRAPGAPVPPPQEFNLRRLFGVEEDVPRRPRPTPSVRRSRPQPPPAAAAKPAVPKVDPSTHIVVFGDAFAELTGQGLDDAFEEMPDVEVVRKVRADSGLVRKEVHDWSKSIREVLDGGQEVTVAVVMLGSNDRQTIREGDESYDPLSPRWLEIYRARIDAVMQPFRERGIPVVWVGNPPMRSDRFSADMVRINEVIREGVERNGGSYVDIWPGFVDDENHYTATGPDVTGQPSRLRASDGVLFTRAGARKAAHFVDAEIKRLIDGKTTGAAIAAVPAVPPTPAEGASVDQIISSSLPSLPEPAGTPPLEPKPLAGPVLPLTRPDLASDGKLITKRPTLEGDHGYTARRALREGVPSPPRPGRADDFRWQGSMAVRE